MASVGDSLANCRTIGLAMFVTALVAALSCLPIHVTAFLLGWIALSIPVGIVVGHCALSAR